MAKSAYTNIWEIANNSKDDINVDMLTNFSNQCYNELLFYCWRSCFFFASAEQLTRCLLFSRRQFALTRPISLLSHLPERHVHCTLANS